MEHATSDNKLIVRARGLVKVYRLGRRNTVTALAGVDLDVPRGSFTVVMGPSGSGKSTLLNVLGCLDTPDEGTLIVDGRDVTRARRSALSDFRLRTVGFVFQQFNLLPHLTALENVMLPLNYRRPRLSAQEKRERAAAALRRVGLGHRLHHRPDELSGGEQQRVGIARAMVNEPKIILADEPTGELDTKTGAEVIEMMYELNRERGQTIILVTHDYAVGQRADQLVFMSDGRIVPRLAELEAPLAPAPPKQS